MPYLKAETCISRKIKCPFYDDKTEIDDCEGCNYFNHYKYKNGDIYVDCNNIEAEGTYILDD